MKYDELKEKIGTYWTANSLGIYECLGTPYYEGDHHFNTEQEGRNHLKREAIQCVKSEEQRINQIVENYKNLPLLKKAMQYVFRGGWKIKSIVEQKRIEREFALQEKLSSINKIKAKSISKTQDWQVKYTPKIGDKFYVAVVQNNSVGMGVYEYTVESDIRFRFNNDKDEVYFDSRGIAVNLSTQESTEMSVEYGEHGLRNGWEYHHVFDTKQEAIDHLDKFIQKMKEDLDRVVKSYSPLN